MAEITIQYSMNTDIFMIILVRFVFVTLILLLVE